ncbi:lipopolysaccharide biosynthesis protein [Candidatus Thiosymbion oneisti]|uniref:lipopolysaccharide biosynthesis protein n=1 Tax=Candidatus Thiosymbion oneisti TaxID=589554 RepID=UPI00105FAC5F|nr:hypothetical protein [Candidatus Thiosymbion oneisti]
MFSTAALRVANVALRGFAMGSKFVLIFVLARLLEPAELGLYGLFAITVRFGTLLIGGDYYIYAQRELLSEDRQRWSFVLQHQAIATGLLYLALLPTQLLLFRFDLLPGSLIVWFFLLLVFEHLAQEINRLLIVMGRPIIGSWIFFIRMGAWVWPLVAIMWLLPRARTLDAIFLAWLLGSALAFALGMLAVIREAAPWRRWPLDYAWLKRGFGVALLFLTATLCSNVMTTADRYIVEALVGRDLLGVYVLYMSIAMAIVAFLDPAVFSFLYPRIVGAYRRGELLAYRRLMKELIWSSIALSLGLAILIALSAPFVLRWTGRSLYVEHLPLLWVLLSVAVIHVIGMAPHYSLYVRGADRVIVLAHISALFVFAAVAVLVAPHAPFYAPAYGLLAGFLWIGGLELVWYRHLARRMR